MNILLINPNRYHYPPVIPVGLEYLYGHIEKSGHKPYILDLCFSEDPEKDIINKVREVNPDIAGFSIRQIDTVLYQNNEFFIDEIKEYVSLCRNMKLKVVLGGSGFSIMPQQIMNYTGADFGIYGPGELGLIQLLNDLEHKMIDGTLINGYDTFSGDQYEFIRGKAFDYSAYIDRQGIVGFRTQIGCTSACFFCTEGRTRVIYHNPVSVGKEIAKLKAEEYSRFHLCDSEFNLNLEHCIKVCKAIIKYTGKIDWTLYMKPEPFNDYLFRWLKESGATLITLSIDTKTSGRKSFPRLAEFFKLADTNKIKVAIDLSVGYPYEVLEQTEEMIAFLDRQPVETIGINSYYRIYPGTPIHRKILKDKSLSKYMVNTAPDNNYLHPVFFRYFSVTQLQELTRGRPKFRIEGFDKNTNYQRVK
jgi:radical SAM superfamily enzyme YgiQ (UPF0313 family)